MDNSGAGADDTCAESARHRRMRAAPFAVAMVVIMVVIVLVVVIVTRMRGANVSEGLQDTLEKVRGACSCLRRAIIPRIFVVILQLGVCQRCCPGKIQRDLCSQSQRSRSDSSDILCRARLCTIHSDMRGSKQSLARLILIAVAVLPCCERCVEEGGVG